MTFSSFGSKPDAPPGLIVMWDEPLSEIPSGWAICDGNNGTPNLLDRFVQNVPDTSTDPGATGGSQSKTLSKSQLAGHSHDASTGSTGSHNHRMGWAYEDTNAHSGSGCDVVVNNSPAGPDSSTDGSHTHKNPSIGNTGGGSSYDNRPRFYEIAYIMKL